MRRYSPWPSVANAPQAAGPATSPTGWEGTVDHDPPGPWRWSSTVWVPRRGRTWPNTATAATPRSSLTESAWNGSRKPRTTSGLARPPCV